jgi:hypothetical protein
MIAIGARIPVADRLNRRLDRAVGLHVRVGSRALHSWRVFSLAAFAVATAIWLALGVARGLPAVALTLPPLVALGIFSAQHRRAVASRRVGRFVFHRHLAASAALTIPVLALAGALNWAVLDTATTCVLAGLAVGRIGCLRVGCCAGRPAAIGPRYPWLGVGERRLPVQLADAAACVALAAATLLCGAVEAAGGIATAIGLGGYFAVRFALDELREERRATARLTEAQWMALTLAVVALGALALR